MVDLPQVPRRIVTTEAPRNRVTPADVAARYRTVADALATGGDALLNYDRATAARSYAIAVEHARNQAQELALASTGNPTGFEKAWSAFSKDTLRRASPSVRDRLTGDLASLGGSHFRTLRGQAHEIEMRAAKASIEVALDHTEADILTMAANGESGTPGFKVARDQYRLLQNELSGNPHFGVSPASADYAVSRLETGIVREIVRRNVATGFVDDPVGARRYAEEALSDPSFPMTPDERRDAVRFAMGSFDEAAAAERDHYAMERDARDSLRRDGYALLARREMTADWIDAHKDSLDLTSIRAFTRSLDQTAPAVRTDPGEYLSLLDLADGDPQAALDQAKDAYAEGRIARDVFDRIYSRATRAGDKSPTRGDGDLRGYIDRSLRPGSGASEADLADHAATIATFDDWLAANPNATRNDARQFADDLIKRSQTTTAARKRQSLPFPRFAWGASPGSLNVDELLRAKQRAAAALRLGWITEDAAREEAKKLMAWDAFLKGAENGR